MQVYCKISSLIGTSTISPHTNMPFSPLSSTSIPLSPLISTPLNISNTSNNNGYPFGLSPTSNVSSNVITNSPPKIPTNLTSQPSTTSLQSLASTTQTSSQNSHNLTPFNSNVSSNSDHQFKRKPSYQHLFKSNNDLPVQYFDLIWKSDNKLKKILILLNKDLNEIAKQTIKDELISLDPSISYDFQQSPQNTTSTNTNNYQYQPLSPVAESIKTHI